MPNNRTNKINSELQKNIYDILIGKVKNPHLTEMFTLTKVDTDKELTVAKVYVSVFSADKDKADATFQAIQSATNFVRSNLFKSMRIRSVPQLTFIRDEQADSGQRIDDLLEKIAEQTAKQERN